MWANDLLLGSEISWWFPNILPLVSGLIGMVPIRLVPKYPVTPAPQNDVIMEQQRLLLEQQTNKPSDTDTNT